jgi:hypothetical protein
MVLDLVQTHGLKALAVVVPIMGLLQAAAGLFKLGQMFRAVSPAVINGMLAGIGVLIFSAQFHVAVDDEPKGSGLDNLMSIPGAIYKGIVPHDGSASREAAIVGLVTLAVLVSMGALRKTFLRKVPPALAAVAVAAVIARFEGRRRAAVAAAVLALLAADLLVFPLRSSEADPGNAAYAALAGSGPGRVLELPIFQRGTAQYGSVYQYYTLQAPRERPTGYALAPEEVFEFTERFNRLECGAWLQGDRAELDRLGIRYLVWHGGLYEQSATPGAWFGWEGLRRSGLGVAGGNRPVLLWDREGSGAAAPEGVRPPPRGEPYLCDAWEDGELTLDEGALWLYGAGRAELELESPAPTVVGVWVDGRAVEPELVAGRATIAVDLPNEDWHPVVVRAAPGLRLVAADLG